MLDSAFQILNILAPSIVLALVGLIWFYKGPEFPVPFVTTLVIHVGMPSLLFYTLVSTTVDLHSMAVLAIAALFTQLVFVLLAVLLLLIAGKDWRQCISHVVGNTGNLGLPVCLFAFGEEGLAYAITFFAVQSFLLFSVGEVIISGSRNWQLLLRSPILHALWLAVVVRVTDYSVPEVALNTLQLAGQVVIPLMLITLGVSLAGMRAAQFRSTLIWSCVRTLTALLIGVTIAQAFSLSGVARGVLIIQTVVPVAVFNYLLAVKHNRETSEVSGMILITHLAAIVYLPPVLVFVL